MAKAGQSSDLRIYNVDLMVDHNVPFYLNIARVPDFPLGDLVYYPGNLKRKAECPRK